jgi:hypothetical protein
MKALCYRELSDFVEMMRLLRYPEEEVSKAIAHESAHLNKARELGYEAEYCIIITDPATLKTRPAIHYYGDRIPSEDDLRKILSAPSDPSDWDMKRLKALEGSV